jgi:hypothetical protein
VNGERFRQYGRVLALIDGLGENGAEAPGSQNLRELAQDMLLSRAPTLEEVEDISDEAALALAHMTTLGVLEREAADEIWRAIRGCGPRSAHEVIELRRPTRSGREN